MKQRTPVTVMWVILFSLGLSLGGENYAQWSYYKHININTLNSGGANVAVTQTRFPVLVRLNRENFDFSQATSNGADIRFTKLNGTRLPHQIEHWDAAGRAAEIWVLVDTVFGSGNTSLRMYFGRGGVADSSSGAAVFATDNGFQGVFHLNEATDDTARDATSNRFKGIPRNVGGSNPGDVPGLIGRAKDFLGNNSGNNGGSYRLATSAGGNTYSGPLDFQNDSATTNGIPAYTISAWVYMDDFPTGMNNRKGIISKSEGVSGQQYQLRLLDPGRNQPGLGSDTNRIDFCDGPTAVYKSGTSGLIPGVWFYVTAVRSGPVGVATNLSVYVNGGNSFSSSNSITPTRHSDYNVYLGSFSNDSGFFSGKLDEVSFSNVARDSNWIRLSYETQKPGANCVMTGPTVSQLSVPSNLTYSYNPASYSTGVAILPNSPTVIGLVTSYSANPPLPAGLSLDPVTGVITGVPSIASAGTYTITGSSSTGSTSMSLSISSSSGQKATSGIVTHFTNGGNNAHIFRIPEGSTAAAVRVSAENIWGRTVWSKTFQTGSGVKTVSWDGTSDNGGPLAEGIYVVRIKPVDATGPVTTHAH